MDKETMSRGEIVYVVRCVPRCDIFETIECKIHNITDEYFTAVSKSRTYLFSYNTKEVYSILADAQEELENRRSAYYATHSKTKEEHLDIHATDDFED